jgi:hypothetical protein
MQDRYVGDAGDFGKYGLLRHLARAFGWDAELRLGVIWYLVDDESGNQDGRHLSYLGDPALTECDSDLRGVLKEIVEGGERCVSLIERRKVLPEGTVFFSERLPSNGPMARIVRTANRQEWFERAFLTTQSCDLVFLDPDNGLEIASTPRGSARSHKYVLMQEVRLLVARRQSVLVYQHMHRRAPHRSQVAEGLARLREAFPDAPSIVATTYRRGSARTFFLLTSPAQDGFLRQRLAGLNRSSWASLFEITYETRQSMKVFKDARGTTRSGVGPGGGAPPAGLEATRPRRPAGRAG